MASNENPYTIKIVGLSPEDIERYRQAIYESEDSKNLIVREVAQDDQHYETLRSIYAPDLEPGSRLYSMTGRLKDLEILDGYVQICRDLDT